MPRKGKKNVFKGSPSWQIKKQAGEKQKSCSDADGNAHADNHDSTLVDASNDDVCQPKLTASERKLGQSSSSELASESQSSEQVQQDDEGYRFVHMSSLKRAFEESHKCKGANIILVEEEDKRYGQSSYLSLQCSKCKRKTGLQTSRSESSAWQPSDATDINRRLVYAACETGIGKEGMATICDILNMHQPMSNQAWNTHTTHLYRAHKSAIEKHLDETRNELYEQLTEDKPEIGDRDEPIDVAVTFDGTWSKRGHTANYGFGFVISVDTGKVLDYGFRSKICWECNNQRFDPNSQEYQQWYESHNEHCSKNFEGSSGNMEVEIAKELWERSKESKLHYKYMVSDGDSKAYSAIWNVYGSCKTCEQFETLSRQSKEYKQWISSEDHEEWKTQHEDGSAVCSRVMKLDCIGHVQKRMGTALRELKKKSKGPLSDGKAIGGRGHRLTDKTIDKLQEYYGKAIRSTTNKDAVRTGSTNESLKKMMKAVWAVLYHCTMLADEEQRHKFCPEGEESWCEYRRTGKSTKERAHYLDAIFLELLKPIFRRLSNRSLLLRCLPGYSQNQNESLNSIVWSKAPKHKFKGPKAIEMAGMAAVLQFDNGQKGRLEVMQLAGIPSGQQTVEGAERKDGKRLYGARRDADMLQKKRRVSQRQAKLQRDQEALQKEGGPSYASGAYNEDPFCHM